jgi:hypothetical protein
MRVAACQGQDDPVRAQWLHPYYPEYAMHALKDLFTTDVGLMSAAGIVFMLGMAVFFVRFFLRHMHEDEARAKAAKR